MTRRAALHVVLLTLCPTMLAAQQPAGQAAPAPQLDSVTRARIEARVLELTKKLFAAREDVDAMKALMSHQEGLCLFETTAAPCGQLEPMLRQLVSRDNPRRVVRQEVDGEELLARALTPTVAVVTAVNRETRSYRQSGEVSRRRFTHLLVYILEDGEWRLSSFTQSSWPVAPPATPATP